MKRVRTKKAKPPVVKAERASQQLAADFSAAKRTIRPFDLRVLGYLLDSRNTIFLKGTPTELRRVLDADNGDEAGFSLLLHTEQNVGVVLPHPYSYYRGLIPDQNS